MISLLYGFRGSYYLLSPGSPPGFYEGQWSSISVYLGRCCDLLVHPVDDVPFVPDDRTRTQLDLLWKGPVSHPAIEGAGAKSSHFKNLRQADETWGVYVLRHQSSSPNRNPGNRRPLTTGGSSAAAFSALVWMPAEPPWV
jgi:hypothetical protein